MNPARFIALYKKYFPPKKQAPVQESQNQKSLADYIHGR